MAPDSLLTGHANFSGASLWAAQGRCRSVRMHVGECDRDALVQQSIILKSANLCCS